jgi:predicted dinucleotide-binding enzyme
MRVAILGTGAVGQALARGFIELEHQTTFGSREPAGPRAQKATAAAPGSRATSFAAAAKDAELVVLATPWSGTQNAINLATPASLAGKVVIDVTLPLDVVGGKPQPALGFNTSGGEQVQSWAPQAKVVKAFNTVGNAMMVKPKLRQTPTMFIAGNDKGGKETVTGLLQQFGWEASDLGGIEGARLLEPFALVWITHAFKKNTWMFALTPVQS